MNLWYNTGNQKGYFSEREIRLRRNPMADIIRVDFTTGQRITDPSPTGHLIPVRRSLSQELISPAESVVETELADDHAADPIKRIEDIELVSSHLIKQGRYRDNMLFIVGINLGLRVSDLVTLRFSHLIDESFAFKTTFPILEKKTKHTRKVRKNRYLTINEAIMDAVELYLTHHPAKLDDYMFRSESNRGGNKNKPLDPYSVERLLKKAAAEVGLQCHVATHTLRKTFGYHQMAMSGNDPRRLLILQKIFGHATSAQTLDYIGITKDEVEAAYMDLNLGSRNCYAKFSALKEVAL